MSTPRKTSEYDKSNETWHYSNFFTLWEEIISEGIFLKLILQFMTQILKKYICVI